MTDHPETGGGEPGGGEARILPGEWHRRLEERRALEQDRGQPEPVPVPPDDVPGTRDEDARLDRQLEAALDQLRAESQRSTEALAAEVKRAEERLAARLEAIAKAEEKLLGTAEAAVTRVREQTHRHLDAVLSELRGLGTGDRPVADG